MRNQALNFVVDENGVEVITTAQALERFRKELLEKAKKNLQIIKDAIEFILVSELVKASGTDFEGYIDKTFDGNIGRNGINGVNDLMALVKTVAMERGIMGPCIAYINANDRRLLLTDEWNNIMFLDAKTFYTRDYDYDVDIEKGTTLFDRDPCISIVYSKEMKEEECDYKLVTKKILTNHCSCSVIDFSFDVEKCKGCDFYGWIAGKLFEGRDVIYVKAI